MKFNSSCASYARDYDIVTKWLYSTLILPPVIYNHMSNSIFGTIYYIITVFLKYEILKVRSRIVIIDFQRR